MRILKLCLVFIGLILCAACSSDSDSLKDEEKPTIRVAYEGGFPQGCEVLKRGETYTFKAQVADNEALAAYSLELHHNFDHHTHDDQSETCDLSPVKEAVNPFIYRENFKLDARPKTYEISIQVSIPDAIDTGDYHCGFSVTDATGWQRRTSVDIKIVE
ncbi:DUF4625 domain-containing protein [Leeuwenhoekiella marinoflava]|uniref:DUF4625 domain-containing protein n=1 Tax=Leeuwenhoekiella marinoflava TaxID=988 RepID=UPI0030028531